MPNIRKTAIGLVLFLLLFTAGATAQNPELPGQVLDAILADHEQRISALEEAVFPTTTEPPPTTTEPPPTTTEPPPTTTEPPPPPPPEEVNCLVSNRAEWELRGENCAYGTLIELTAGPGEDPDHDQFDCTGPLSNLGPLPIKVVHTYTGLVDTGDQGGMDLSGGCRGDGNPDTIDLIYHSNANGSTLGSCGGGGKLRATPPPRDLQITGNFDGGAVCGGAHQDGVQMQVGDLSGTVAIVNGTSGDWDAGTSTIVGAGGSIFFSAFYRVDILGGRYVSCNHGYFGNIASGNRVEDAGFRTGRVDGTDPKCAGIFSPPADNPCASGATYVNTICQRWDSASRTWVDKGVG